MRPLVFALAALAALACSSSASIHCSSGTNSNGTEACLCTLTGSATSSTCDQTLASASATCCADPKWPSAGFCSCTQVTCSTDGSTTCHCGFDLSGNKSSCSLPTGVCCTNGNDCTCYPNQTSCGGQTQVASCSAATMGCATFAASDGTTGGKQVTSCSAP